MSYWKFRKMSKGEKNADPIQGNFFTTKDVENLTNSLVRESIQNSLDAKDKSVKDPVKVRFYLSGSKYSINWNDISGYFQGILPHIKAENNGLQPGNTPAMPSSLSFLLFEDFNTRGLEGDVLEDEDPENGENVPHNFYWFWRNVGRSGKVGNERGRWGLGKTVFPAASRINTYFGLTVRKNDSKKYLMGESVLNIHKDKKGNKINPYGYFGEYENEETDDCFVLPIECSSTQTDFEKKFFLERTDKNGYAKPGLSILIPYPQEEISADEIIRGVLVQYFYPILTGELHVEVMDGNADDVFDIRKDTITELIQSDKLNFADEKKKNSLLSLFELAKWAIDVRSDEFITLSAPSLSSSPLWRKEWYLKNGVEAIIKANIERFDRGKPLAFLIPVKYHMVGGNPFMSYFKMFIEKDINLKESDSHFVRAGITVTGISKPRKKDLRVIVVIDDENLEKLLGDAENPAHTEWQKDSAHFKNKYVEGEKVLSFVTIAPTKIYEFLTVPTTDIDKDILRDIFYISNDSVTDDDEFESHDDDGEGPPMPPLPNPDRTPSQFTVNKITGGFTIEGNGYPSEQPISVNIKLAYLVPNGNPLKKFRNFDFNLNNPEMMIQVEGADYQILEANELIIQAPGNNYSVQVTGFDVNRDIFIKAVTL